MTTIETIITQLNRISADSRYQIINNRIYLTIDDFDGFDENWIEIDREFVNEKAIEEVLEWLEENADYIDDDFYCDYYFGEIIVRVQYSSSDI